MNFPPLGSGTSEDGESSTKTEAKEAPPAKSFTPSEGFEQMLDAKPLTLSLVKPVAPVNLAPPVPPSKGKAKSKVGEGSRYRIQLSAESSLEAAQKRKAEFEGKLGGHVDVDFDPPYYKLRFGQFESRQEAQDKLLEISDLKLQGFVIQQ